MPFIFICIAAITVMIAPRQQFRAMTLTKICLLTGINLEENGRTLVLMVEEENRTGGRARQANKNNNLVILIKLNILNRDAVVAASWGILEL